MKSADMKKYNGGKDRELTVEELEKIKKVIQDIERIEKEDAEYMR